MTTVGAWVQGQLVSEQATPDGFVRAVERAVLAGVKTIAVETTSQALMQGFAARWPPRVAVFTNLSRDHLDVHKTGEEYLAAKAQLFTSLDAEAVAVVNDDDKYSDRMIQDCCSRIIRFGFAGSGRVTRHPVGCASPRAAVLISDSALLMLMSVWPQLYASVRADVSSRAKSLR